MDSGINILKLLTKFEFPAIPCSLSLAIWKGVCNLV